MEIYAGEKNTMNEDNLNIDDFRSEDIGLDYEQSLEYDAMKFFDCSADVSDAICPLCASSDNNKIHSLYEFSILECMCGFMYSFPRPTEQQQHNFYQHGRSNMLWHKILDETKDKRKENYSNNIVPLLYHHLGPEYDGKIADIGCGKGLWLDALKEALPKAELFGVEPFADNDLIKNHRVIRCFLEEMVEEYSCEFDVCSLMSVIEHVSDPIGCLKKSYSILGDGGLLFLTVPNVAGFDSTALEPADRNWEIPQHINYFDLASAKCCAIAAGFKIIESGTFGFLDVDIVSKRVNDIKNDFLIRLLTRSSDSTKKEFQRFLTDNGLSGQLYIIAKKEPPGV